MLATWEPPLEVALAVWVATVVGRRECAKSHGQRRMIVDAGWVAVGLLMVGFGVYFYLTPNFQSRIRDNYAFRANLLPRSGVYGALPSGLAIICLGLAKIISTGPFSDLLMSAAAVLLLVALLAILWHPNWIRPRWARDVKDGTN